MATMYENVGMWHLCGWNRVDICMTFHKPAFDFFIPLHVDLTIFKIHSKTNDRLEFYLILKYVFL
jgi:hypothetical protein